MKHLVFLLLFVAIPLAAQSNQPPPATSEEPHEVSFCDLADSPAAHNHELVRMSGFVTHGFEDFHLSEPFCSRAQTDFSIWLTYGGTAESNTIYCCPGEPGQKERPSLLTVEGIAMPLVSDQNLAKFRKLLDKEPDTTVRTTLVGRFFSGERRTIKEKSSYGGYGHLGCCSLLVIQRVESFDSHLRTDLDYTAEAGWQESEGCKASSVHVPLHLSVSEHEEGFKEAVEAQEMADGGSRSWAFDNPRRVAEEALASLYQEQAPRLKQVKETPARQVFRWKRGKKSTVVVVTRPAWLASHAKTNSIVWVATTIKEAECR